MPSFLLISGFALLGVWSRYGIDLALKPWHEQFPYSTLLINILGSFIAGAIYAYAAERDLAAGINTALIVGFCGGFTTFSAYALQSMALFEKGRAGAALGYLIVSPALGLCAVFVGVLLMRKILGA